MPADCILCTREKSARRSYRAESVEAALYLPEYTSLQDAEFVSFCFRSARKDTRADLSAWVCLVHITSSTIT